MFITVSAGKLSRLVLKDSFVSKGKAFPLEVLPSEWPFGVASLDKHFVRMVSSEPYAREPFPIVMKMGFKECSY